MKITQKCGPCGGELTVEDDDADRAGRIVGRWQVEHPCIRPDQRTGVGFAATSPATDRADPYLRSLQYEPGPRRVEATGQRNPVIRPEVTP